MVTQCCHAARPARAAQGYNDGLSSESAAASEPRPQLSQEAAAAASFDKSELAPVTNQLLQEARPCHPALSRVARALLFLEVTSLKYAALYLPEHVGGLLATLFVHRYSQGIQGHGKA